MYPNFPSSSNSNQMFCEFGSSIRWGYMSFANMDFGMNGINHIWWISKDEIVITINIIPPSIMVQALLASLRLSQRNCKCHFWLFVYWLEPASLSWIKSKIAQRTQSSKHRREQLWVLTRLRCWTTDLHSDTTRIPVSLNPTHSSLYCEPNSGTSPTEPAIIH